MKSNLSPKVREKFGRGLINAVLSTQAWVITSGIDLGIAKEVGDAVKAGFFIDVVMPCSDWPTYLIG